VSDGGTVVVVGRHDGGVEEVIGEKVYWKTLDRRRPGLFRVDSEEDYSLPERRVTMP
jgi:hypothetical protein